MHCISLKTTGCLFVFSHSNSSSFVSDIPHWKPTDLKNGHSHPLIRYPQKARWNQGFSTCQALKQPNLVSTRVFEGLVASKKKLWRKCWKRRNTDETQKDLRVLLGWFLLEDWVWLFWVMLVGCLLFFVGYFCGWKTKTWENKTWFCRGLTHKTVITKVRSPFIGVIWLSSQI